MYPLQVVGQIMASCTLDQMISKPQQQLQLVWNVSPSMEYWCSIHLMKWITSLETFRGGPVPFLCSVFEGSRAFRYISFNLVIKICMIVRVSSAIFPLEQMNSYQQVQFLLTSAPNARSVSMQRLGGSVYMQSQLLLMRAQNDLSRTLILNLGSKIEPIAYSKDQLWDIRWWMHLCWSPEWLYSC